MADAHAKEHDYHLVEPSPWPLVGSISAFILAIGAIAFMRSKGGGDGLLGIKGPTMMYVGLAAVAFTMFMWWRDVIKEAHAGDHTPVVQLHLRYGMIMFIASEVMFFVAWFWAYFDIALFPGGVGALPNSTEVIGQFERNNLTGGHWPPKPVEAFQETFNPWQLPLVNTLILLTSGTTVTWAHHALLNNDRKGLIWGLTLTVVLGFIFTLLQAFEYGHAAFNFAGHIYGSTFFMATGFHGASTSSSVRSSLPSACSGR